MARYPAAIDFGWPEYSRAHQRASIPALAAISAWAATALLLATTVAAEVPTVTLSLMNLARVPRWTLEAAQDGVATAYKRIAVRVAWTDQRINSGPGRLTIVLLAAQDEADYLIGPGASPKTLGFAPSGSGRVYVLCERVSAFARTNVRTMALVLGHVLTHEIGHQLLPGQGHASTGIMREELDYSSVVETWFSPEQGASIRALLATQAEVRADLGGPSVNWAAIGGPFIGSLSKRAPNRIPAAVMAQPVGWHPEMRDPKYPGTFWKSWGPALIAKRLEIDVEQTMAHHGRGAVRRHVDHRVFAAFDRGLRTLAGAAITTSPAIAAGRVVIGSQDGTVYALG